jgi:hypothetical protein
MLCPLNTLLLLAAGVVDQYPAVEVVLEGLELTQDLL